VFGKIHNYAVKTFKNKAQFNLKDLRNAVKKDKCEIPIERLIELLEHHKIVMKLPTRSSDPENPEYFMPCALRSASLDELEQTKLHPLLSPLMVLYDCGFVPLGVFCSLLISLAFDNENDWELIDDECLYRNMVQFRVGEAKITLMCEPKYLKVVLDTTTNKVALICQDVRESLYSKLKEVAADLNYHNSNFEFGFRCSCELKEIHQGVVKEQQILRCMKKKERIFSLEKSQRRWFEVSNMF